MNHSDLVLGDCSITYAESTAGQYAIFGGIYSGLAFLSLLISLFFLRTFRVKRAESKTPHLHSTPEKMTMLNIVLAVCLGVASIDSMNYSGQLPILLVSALRGVCSGSALTLVIYLVRTWITIVDGGKSKQEPNWSKMMGRICPVIGIVGEVGGSVLENFMTDGKGVDGCFNGNVNAVKSMSYGTILFIYLVVCIRYGRIIGAQLASGGAGGASAGANIRRYLYLCTLGMGVGVLFKVFVTITRAGK